MAAPHGPAPRGRRYHFATAGEWAAFFLGTPRRFFTSMVLVLVAIGVASPDRAAEVADRAAQTMAAALGYALQSALQAISPILPGIATIVVMVLILRALVRRISGRR